MKLGTGDTDNMGNVSPHMIGNLLMLVTAMGALGVVAAVLQNLLHPRVPVPVRVDDDEDRSRRELGG